MIQCSLCIYLNIAENLEEEGLSFVKVFNFKLLGPNFFGMKILMIVILAQFWKCKSYAVSEISVCPSWTKGDFGMDSHVQ